MPAFGERLTLPGAGKLLLAKKRKLYQHCFTDWGLAGTSKIETKACNRSLLTKRAASVVSMDDIMNKAPRAAVGEENEAPNPRHVLTEAQQAEWRYCWVF